MPTFLYGTLLNGAPDVLGFDGVTQLVVVLGEGDDLLEFEDFSFEGRISVRGGGSNDPNQIREMIAAVVDGMYVSLYATLLGIACNLWLKVNLRLLGNYHG